MDETSKRFFRQVKMPQFQYGRLYENACVEVELLCGFFYFLMEKPGYGAGKRNGQLPVSFVGNHVALEEVGETGCQKIMYFRL